MAAAVLQAAHPVCLPVRNAICSPDTRVPSHVHSARSCLVRTEQLLILRAVSSARFSHIRCVIICYKSVVYQHVYAIYIAYMHLCRRTSPGKPARCSARRSVRARNRNDQAQNSLKQSDKQRTCAVSTRAGSARPRPATTARASPAVCCSSGPGQATWLWVAAPGKPRGSGPLALQHGPLRQQRRAVPGGAAEFLVPRRPGEGGTQKRCARARQLTTASRAPAAARCPTALLRALVCHAAPQFRHADSTAVPCRDWGCERQTAHPAMSMCAHCTLAVSTYCCRNSAAVMLPAYLLPAFCSGCTSGRVGQG